MERTIARVTTLQSINAKASKIEWDPDLTNEAQVIIDENTNFPSIFALDDMASFAANHVVDSEGTIREQLEDMAAFFVLAAQKERERESERPRNQGIS